MMLKVNLAKPGVSLRVAKASKDGSEILAARQKTSEMMKEANNDSTVAVAAVNGGFFTLKTGRPVNLDIEDGMIARLPGAKRRFSSLLITSDNRAKIGRYDLDVALAVSDTTFDINDINKVSPTDRTVLFDRFYGSKTPSDFHGGAVVLEPIGTSLVGGVFKYVADTLVRSSGSFSIPRSGYVLVCRGRVDLTLLRKLSICDTVWMLTQFTPQADDVRQALGGLPEIVHDGRNVSAANADSEKVNSYIRDEHHARTAIGVSREGRKVVLVVVNGDEKAIPGMTLSELTNLMVRLGSYNALNLDGGGSSTMVVDGKIVNSPSDSTGERAVSNALVVTVTK